MNLIKALSGLSIPSEQEAEKSVPPPTTAKITSTPSESAVNDYNAMANVIAKHEQISNRVRTGTKRN